MATDPEPDPRIISTLQNAGYDPARVPADSISIGGGWMQFQIDFGRGLRTDLRDRCIPFPLDWSDVAPLPVNPGAHEDQDGRIWILLGHGRAWTCPTDGGQIIPEGPMQDQMVRQSGVLTLTRLDTRAEWERHQRNADHTAKTTQREEQNMASGTSMKNPDSGDEDFGKDQHEVDRIASFDTETFDRFVENATTGALRSLIRMAGNVSGEHDRRGAQARRLQTRIQTAVRETIGSGPEEASERVFPGGIPGVDYPQG